MMFSAVDLLSTNSLSDDLNHNPVTSNFHRKRARIYCEWSLWTNTECLQILRACLHARKKTERFFASNSKYIVYFNKMFCWKSFLLIFVSLSIHIYESDLCVNKENLHERVAIWYTKGLHQNAVNFSNFCVQVCFFGKWLVGNHIILRQKIFV